MYFQETARAHREMRPGCTSLTARPAAVDGAGATGKGKGGKSRADQEDIDALLAELEAPKQPAAEGTVSQTLCKGIRMGAPV